MIGQGYCDEQCNTLLSLVNTLKLKGRLIFLYGKDSISHHSVCEIKIDNQYCMFDPFYGIIIRDKYGKIVCVKSIVDRIKLIKSTPKNSEISINEYKALYSKKYGYKIAKYNQILQLPDEKRIHTYYTIWYLIFGESSRKRLFSYYYKMNQVAYKEQKKINKLFE